MEPFPESSGLREATSNDAQVFAEWEKKERPYPWPATQFLKSSGHVLVLEKKVVEGFVVFQKVGTEGYLQNLMINLQSRRSGLGVELLKKALIWAKKNQITDVFLDVQADNKPAIALYEKCGFKMIQVKKNAYPKGETGLLFKITL